MKKDFTHFTREDLWEILVEVIESINCVEGMPPSYYVEMAFPQSKSKLKEIEFSVLSSPSPLKGYV